MSQRRVIWPTPVRTKLLAVRNPRFTPEETLDFLTGFILETEELLLTPAVKALYIEECGKFEGLSRCVVRGFRVYYELVGDDVVILAVKFPREN